MMKIPIKAIFSLIAFIFVYTIASTGSIYSSAHEEQIPPPYRPQLIQFNISSNDGLKLTFLGERYVASVSINGTQIPMLKTEGGFSFREVMTDAPNLINNPGFEDGLNIPSNWSFVTSGENVPNTDTISHSGARSVKISVPGTINGRSGYPKSDLIQVEPLAYYSFSAWGKTQNISGMYGAAVRVVELDGNKKWLRQTNLVFGMGTNDWAKKEITFHNGFDTSWVYVYANIWEGYGTFWVDDVVLEPFFGTTIYLKGVTEQNPDGTIIQRAQVNDIDFTFYYIPEDRYIEIQGEIQDLRGEDRALQVMFNVPVNLTGWYWNDDVNNRRIITEKVQYENIASYKQWQNKYPFGLIDNAIYNGISIAVPKISDVYISYNTFNGYLLQQDLGAFGLNKINSTVKDFRLILYNTVEPNFNEAREKYNYIFHLPGNISEQNYSHIIYIYEENIFVKNGSTGEIENSGSYTNATSLIQYTLDKPTSDRKKFVALIGNFSVSGLNVKNNTVLDLRDAEIISSGNTIPLRLSGINNSEIIGGVIDCDSQTDADQNMRCISLINTDNVTIDGTEVMNGGYYGINLWQANNNTIKNVYSHDNFINGIHLGSDKAGRGWYNKVKNSTFNNNGISGLSDRGSTIPKEILYNSYDSIIAINNSATSDSRGIFISGAVSFDAVFTLNNITVLNNTHGLKAENASVYITNLNASSNNGSGLYLRAVRNSTIINVTANDNGQKAYSGGIRIVDLFGRASQDIIIIGTEVRRNWRNLYVFSNVGSKNITLDSIDATEGVNSNVLIYGANVTILNVRGYP